MLCASHPNAVYKRKRTQLSQHAPNLTKTLCASLDAFWASGLSHSGTRPGPKPSEWRLPHIFGTVTRKKRKRDHCNGLIRSHRDSGDELGASRNKNACLDLPHYRWLPSSTRGTRCNAARRRRNSASPNRSGAASCNARQRATARPFSGASSIIAESRTSVSSSRCGC